MARSAAALPTRNVATMDAEQHFATLASVWDDQAEALDASMGEHGSAARTALAAAPGERIVQHHLLVGSEIVAQLKFSWWTGDMPAVSIQSSPLIAGPTLTEAANGTSPN